MKYEDGGEDDKTESTIFHRIGLYVLGILSLLISMIWTTYELNAKLIHYEEIVPELSFAFDISGIFFSLSLLVGVHRNRLDYMTPYFLMSLILGGYCVTVILTVISRWSFLSHPAKPLILASIGLILAIINFVALFKYTERLKASQGIYSTWRRLRGKEKPLNQSDEEE
jgi:tellurite resistance protein TehA-like permease